MGGMQKKHRQGREGKLRKRKEGETSYTSFFFLNTTETEIQDLYMSGMEEARLRWLELSEDEGREMKKRGGTTQASSPSLGCLAVTSASLL